MAGLKLVYGANEKVAQAGGLLEFTAWIINETKRPIKRVELVPGSFTNEDMTKLHYVSQPSADELRIGLLGAGESVHRTFSYRVMPEDVLHGGELISAMRVRGVAMFRTLRDEDDAAVALIP